MLGDPRRVSNMAVGAVRIMLGGFKYSNYNAMNMKLYINKVPFFAQTFFM